MFNVFFCVWMSKRQGMSFVDPRSPTCHCTIVITSQLRNNHVAGYTQCRATIQRTRENYNGTIVSNPDAAVLEEDMLTRRRQQRDSIFAFCSLIWQVPVDRVARSFLKQTAKIVKSTHKKILEELILAVFSERVEYFLQGRYALYENLFPNFPQRFCCGNFVYKVCER